MLAVEGISIGIAERNHFLLLAIETEPVNLVDGFVAYVEKTRIIPHRPLRKSEARTYYAEFGVVIHQIPKVWRLRLQLKLSGLGWSVCEACAHRNQGCDNENMQNIRVAIHEDALPNKILS